MDPSALESVSRSLESSLDFWGVILASTGVVVLGLVIEYWEPVRDFIEECQRPAAAFPWKKFMGLAGGILVTVGVAGELGFTYKASRVETKLRENNHKIEESLTKQAGDAKTSAEDAAAASSRAQEKAGNLAKQADALTARMESASRQLSALERDIITQGPRWSLLAKVAPELTKQLSAFTGQRVELFVCGRPGMADGETLSTWGTIANMLEADGAKWKVEHGGLSFFDRCSPSGGQPLGQGLMVFVSKRASGTTMEAAKALSEGLAKALPPSPNKMPGIIDPDFSQRFSQPIEGKDTPWAMVANDPELITVLIGAHPQ